MNNTLEKFQETKNNGIPLFSEDNVTTKAKNELDLITRKVLSDRHVTLEQFNDMFRDSVKELKDMDKSMISNQKTNLLTAVRNGRISFGKLKECLCSVLGLKLKDIKFTFEDTNGEPYYVRLRND